jgi:hypothetical protein
MKCEFRFEFEDESNSRNQALTYEVADPLSRLTTATDNGAFVLTGNQAGFLVLSRILAQIGSCDYRNGFHIHIQQDFDPDKPDRLTVVLDRS